MTKGRDGIVEINYFYGIFRRIAEIWGLRPQLSDFGRYMSEGMGAIPQFLGVDMNGYSLLYALKINAP